MANLPIVTPHGYTDPRWYGEDQPFPNPGTLFVEPDHYIFRMLYRASGSPQQQASTYDEGYFHPGPTAKNVTLDMAPPEGQAAIKEFGRPQYENLIAENPIETPLEPDMMAQAFKRWDQEIGSGAKRKG